MHPSTPMDYQEMLKAGFDRALSGLEIINAGNGRAGARIIVSEATQNLFGNLHGGAIATIVDDIGSIAIAATDRFRRVGVTTDLNVSYLAAAKRNDVVLVEAEVLMSGLRMAFVEVTLRRETDQKILARARMTKFLGEEKPD